MLRFLSAVLLTALLSTPVEAFQGGPGGNPGNGVGPPAGPPGPGRGRARGRGRGGPPGAPELDLASGRTAMVLTACGLLMIAGRRRRREELHLAPVRDENEH